MTGAGPALWRMLRRPRIVVAGLLLASASAATACSTPGSTVSAPASIAGSPSTEPNGPPDDSAPPSPAAGSPAASGGSLVVGGDRPVAVQVPSGLDPAVPAPLLLYLHGYSASSAELEAWLPLGADALARGMVVALPDGSADRAGDRFWNATDACCDWFAEGVDDSAYLADVISQISARLTIDPKRIYVAGHSNGAFMSYRMACDHADTVAAVVSIAGATFDDPDRCRPPEPVAVLQIHGTADRNVDFDGGTLTPNLAGAGPVAYPGARGSTSRWNAYDGCADRGIVATTLLDLDANRNGSDGPAETTAETFDEGCLPGGHTELWSIDGGLHVPSFTADTPRRIVDFLLAHPKP